MHQKETTHVKDGRITQPNLIRTIKKQTRPNLDSVIEWDYANGQLKLAPETSKHCNFAITREKKRTLPIPEKILQAGDIPTIFQEKIDRTLGNETPVWLNDIIITTRGTK